MKRCSVRMWFRRGILWICVLVMAGMGTPLLAQAPAGPPPGQARAQALPPQQLDNLVAPIALYPDPLLGQVLAACTYPVELVEAQQWLQANGNLHGQQLMDAARQQNWDASVQALVAMPDVLAKLTQDIRWTTDLGNAFLAQQADVMSAVQRMRARAQANGKLQSNPQETVTTENQGGQSAIEIQPADPAGDLRPDLRPHLCLGASGVGILSAALLSGLRILVRTRNRHRTVLRRLGRLGLGRLGLGLGPELVRRRPIRQQRLLQSLWISPRLRFRRRTRGRTAWAHDPGHRLGVAYPNSQLNSRFGAASQASRMAAGQSGELAQVRRG